MLAQPYCEGIFARYIARILVPMEMLRADHRECTDPPNHLETRGSLARRVRPTIPTGLLLPQRKP